MQEVPRALLLPPPGPLPRNATRGPSALDHDLPNDVERGTPRVGGGEDAHFLALLDATGEDTIELKGKQFRFRPYNRGGATERGQAETIFERPSSDGAAAQAPEAAKDADVAADVLAGFGSGAGARNSSAFLASFIAQERLSQGLHNPQHASASNAYRRAGGSPPPDSGAPRVVRMAA
jgi:hypothetical protein